jgi:hypothetical protein
VACYTNENKAKIAKVHRLASPVSGSRDTVRRMASCHGWFRTLLSWSGNGDVVKISHSALAGFEILQFMLFAVIFIPQIAELEERWQSGRMRRIANPLYWSRPVPRVRIPPSPPHYEARRARQGAPLELRAVGRIIRKSSQVYRRQLPGIVRAAV